jgi:hypothetical protein
MAEADWEAGLVVLPRALLDRFGDPRASAVPQSPNVIKGWSRTWKEVPDCTLKDQLFSRIRTFTEALPEGFAKAFAEGFAKAFATQDAGCRMQDAGKSMPRSRAAPGRQAGGDFAVAEGTSPGKPARKKRPPSGDHQTLVAEFDGLYAEANGGARPTWGAKQGALVAKLLKAHGLEECRRRAANMFRAPPPWPPPPHDIGTLSQHFDRFAQPHKAAGGHFKVTGEEQYAGGEVEI